MNKNDVTKQWTELLKKIVDGEDTEGFVDKATTIIVDNFIKLKLKDVLLKLRGFYDEDR